MLNSENFNFCWNSHTLNTWHAYSISPSLYLPLSGHLSLLPSQGIELLHPFLLFLFEVFFSPFSILPDLLNYQIHNKCLLPFKIIQSFSLVERMSHPGRQKSWCLPHLWVTTVMCPSWVKITTKQDNSGVHIVSCLCSFVCIMVG